MFDEIFLIYIYIYIYIIYTKRRYAACPPPRLTCYLSFKNLQNWRRSGEKKRAGRGHDFPRRSLHLRIVLGKLLERSSQIPMKWRSRANQKSIKKWSKNRPQEGYPIGSGAPWRALGRSWAALEHGTLITTIFVLFSCGSWAHLGGVLGPKLGVLGAKTTQKILPRRPMMPLRCLQDSPRSDFHQKSRKNWALRARMAFSIRF